MGQRSQIYIRYNNSETLVAKHLQWNYGGYMINRTYQLLNYLNKNIQNEYSNFNSKHFDITNRNNRQDLKILDALISLNLIIGSYVGNIDLIEEKLEWLNKNDNREKFIFDPNYQDNNNGILVIDILEDKKNKMTLKYALAKGYEEYKKDEKFERFKVCSALDYMIASQPNFEYLKKNCSKERVDEEKEIYTENLKQASIIDEKFKLMTDKEFKDFFSKEYEYSKCLSESTLDKCLKELEKNIKKHELTLKQMLVNKINNIENNLLNYDHERIKNLEDSKLLTEIIGTDGISYYNYIDKAIVKTDGYINDIILDETKISEILGTK